MYQDLALVSSLPKQSIIVFEEHRTQCLLYKESLVDFFLLYPFVIVYATDCLCDPPPEISLLRYLFEMRPPFSSIEALYLFPSEIVPLFMFIVAIKWTMYQKHACKISTL